MTAALTGCALQGSLWDVGEEAGLRELGGSVRRTVLSRGAWLDLRPAGRPAPTRCSTRLIDDRPVARRAPADVRAGRRRPPAAQLLRRGRAAARPAARPRPARDLTGTTPASSASRSSPPACASTATAATASPGTATRIGRSRTEDTMVAIVSLGAPRAAAAAPARRRRRRCGYQLGHGDLVVMGGSCQRTWEHAIPKTAPPGRPADQRPVPHPRSPVARSRCRVAAAAGTGRQPARAQAARARPGGPPAGWAAGRKGSVALGAVDAPRRPP